MPLSLARISSMFWLPLLKVGVSSDYYALQLKATSQFHKLLSKKNSPIEEVIACGVVPRFVQFLARDDLPELQWEAIQVLTDIATGTMENAEVVIEHGAIPIFVKLLNSPTDYISEQAVWGLGMLAAHSPQLRDLALRHGALTSLISQLNMHPKSYMLESATWTLSNFCMTSNLEQKKLVLPALKRLIHSTDEEVLSHACTALSNICLGTDEGQAVTEGIQAVIEAKVCQRLVDLWLHPSPSVVIQALWAVGNIGCLGDTQIQSIINRSLPSLKILITQNHNDSIKEEACSTISSHILGGNEEQIQSLIAGGIIGPLVNLLQTAEFDIKKEAAYAIVNAINNGSAQQIKYLVSLGCIRGLCDFLVSPDPEIVELFLDGLENILKVGETEKIADINIYAELIETAELLEKIENLQSHDNGEISEKAVAMLRTYWHKDEYAAQDGRNEVSVLRVDSITLN
ncbi:hypothetical protein ACHQM5_022796 [Ranunculus cassubicifolius]